MSQKQSSRGVGRAARFIVAGLIVAIASTTMPHDVDEASAASRACGQIMGEYEPRPDDDGGDDETC